MAISKKNIASMGHFHFTFQFITHQNERHSYLEGAYLALIGGCRWIQLRMKGATDEEVEPIARKLLEVCRDADATFILDDRVHLARKIGADGVHLGRADMPISEARRILGPDFVIGGTANTAADIRRIAAEGADYIGCGPFRFTTTKEKLAPTLGLEGYRRILSEMKADDVCLPMVAIGGITLADVKPLTEMGIGVAVSGAVLGAEKPVTMARKFQEECFGLAMHRLAELTSPDGADD